MNPNLNIYLMVHSIERDLREARASRAWMATDAVIDCPDPKKSQGTLDAVAGDGIQLKARARVTVRTNIQQLIGGADHGAPGRADGRAHGPVHRRAQWPG